jgi:hypothetical protein
MQKIYLPYYELTACNQPAMNWVPYAQPEPSELEINLGFDSRLQRKLVSDIRPDDRWLYELNWFYTADEFNLDWPILDRLMSNKLLMDGVYNGQGRLLINLSGEGFIPWPPARFVEFMQHRNIPSAAVIWAGGARNLPNLLAQYNIPFLPLHIRMWESYSCYYHKSRTVQLPQRDVIDKRFICFNRLFRSHRFHLLALLHQQKLLSEFYFSFARRCQGSDAKIAVRQQCSGLHDTDQVINSIDQLYDHLPMVLDRSDYDRNLIMPQLMDSALHYYMRSGISIVTETFFDRQDLFISEKSYNPMRYLQPFIIVGQAGTLSALRSDGYKTFDTWWDESYDDVIDDQARMHIVVDIISRIAAWSDSKFKQFLIDSREICLHNLRLLESCHDRLDYIADISKIFD